MARPLKLPKYTYGQKVRILDPYWRAFYGQDLCGYIHLSFKHKSKIYYTGIFDIEKSMWDPEEITGFEIEEKLLLPATTQLKVIR